MTWCLSLWGRKGVNPAGASGLGDWVDNSASHSAVFIKPLCT